MLDLWSAILSEIQHISLRITAYRIIDQERQQQILRIYNKNVTCSDNGAETSMFWIATFPARMFASVSSMVLVLPNKRIFFTT